MKRFAAWVLAATLAVSMLAGCGGASTSTETKNEQSQPATTTQSNEPQVLTLNLGSEPPQLDSAITTDAVSFDVLNQVMEGLVRVGEGGVIKPGSGQAASWTVSPDQLQYTFTLKDGLKWSDGKPVTSKDFAYAWFRVLDPKTASEYNYQLFYIKGAEAWSSLDTKAADFAQKYDELKKKVAIETPDDKTIKVTLTGPTPYFLGLMNFPTYFPQRQDIVEQFKDKYAAESTNIIFNGPFAIKSWKHESEIVLEKNPSYWDAASVKMQTVNYKMIQDSNTAVNMFEANQLDSVGLPGQYIAQYKDKAGFHSEAQTTVFYLAFNMSGQNKAKSYLLNKHIRKALSLAVDRDQFVNAVMRNGSAAAVGLVPDSIHINGDSYRKAAGPLVGTKADTTAAQKELAEGLKELGLDKLPALEFLTDTGDVAKKYAQGVQGMVQQNLPGVTINIVPIEFKVRLEREKKGDFDIVLSGWGADYDDPNTFLNLFITDGGQNKPKYSNPAYDKLIKDASNEAAAKKRLDDFVQAEKLLMDDLPILPLYVRTTNRIRRPYVKGIIDYQVGPDFDLKYATIEGKTAK